MCNNRAPFPLYSTVFFKQKDIVVPVYLITTSNTKFLLKNKHTKHQLEAPISREAPF